MAPLLHMMEASPPVRAVLMAAKEMEIDLELKECDLLQDENLTEEFKKLNPAHTIPTLVDDGFAVWESAAIMGYLVNKYGKNDSLYPKSPKERAVVDQLLHFSTSSFAKFLSVFRPVFLRLIVKANVPKEKIEQLFHCVEILENIIGTNKYVTGEQLTLADFSLVAMISSLDVGFPVTAERFPNVVAWWKRMEQLPSYDANRKGLASFSSYWADRE